MGFHENEEQAKSLRHEWLKKVLGGTDLGVLCEQLHMSPEESAAFQRTDEGKMFLLSIGMMLDKNNMIINHLGPLVMDCQGRLKELEGGRKLIVPGRPDIGGN